MLARFHDTFQSIKALGKKQPDELPEPVYIKFNTSNRGRIRWYAYRYDKLEAQGHPHGFQNRKDAQRHAMNFLRAPVIIDLKNEKFDYSWQEYANHREFTSI